MSYRTTPHTTTKATPASLMFRGKFRTWLPEMKNIETKMMMRKQTKRCKE